jgi:RNA polymerase sigma-70 factor (ECF subfamily)
MSIHKADEEAFTSLFYTYKDKLYGFFKALTHSHTEATNMVQEVFMKIWRNREKLSFVDNMNAYIFRAAQNLAIDQLRKKSSEILSFTDGYSGNDQESDEGSPFEQLMSKELSKSLKEAIEKLPPQQKKIFVSHCIDGLPHNEIAKNMNLSVSTVQNHMRAALSNIRMFLSGNYPVIVLLWILSNLD